MTSVEVIAEMARHGLLSGQLGSYENPDTERWVNPRTDPERIREAWEFLSWLEKQAQASDDPPAPLRLRLSERLAAMSGEDLLRGSRRRGFRKATPAQMERARDRVLAEWAAYRRRP